MQVVIRGPPCIIRPTLSTCLSDTDNYERFRFILSKDWQQRRRFLDFAGPQQRAMRLIGNSDAPREVSQRLAREGGGSGPG